MAFIPFPEGALAIVEYGGATLRWTNTLWFEDVVADTPQLQDLADYLVEWAGDHVMPELADEWVVHKVTVYDVQTATGPIVIATDGVTAGGVTGDSAAVNAALVVTFRSASRGRSSRGRNYITGLVEADVGPNSVTNSTRVANLVDAYEDLRDTIQQATGYYWVVASKYSEGAARSEVLSLQIETVEVRHVILGSQRRRTRGSAHQAQGLFDAGAGRTGTGFDTICTASQITGCVGSQR